MSASFQDWMKTIQAGMEQDLSCYLPAADLVPSRLHAAMRYAVLDGGKRVRPLLVHAAGALFGADAQALSRAAAALEMIHAYSLVHDDMPCMDDDALRRGKPTVHVAYDEATALLVGDALQAQAFSVLAHTDTLPTRRAGGSVSGKDLTEAELKALHDYSRAIGLSFQVVDDVLDATAESATVGKTAGKDAADNKPTYVSILGLEPSIALAEKLRQDAHAALTPFGEQALRLRELADLIVQRKA